MIWNKAFFSLLSFRSALLLPRSRSDRIAPVPVPYALVFVDALTEADECTAGAVESV